MVQHNHAYHQHIVSSCKDMILMLVLGLPLVMPWRHLLVKVLTESFLYSFSNLCFVFCSVSCTFLSKDLVGSVSSFRNWLVFNSDTTILVSNNFHMFFLSLFSVCPVVIDHDFVYVSVCDRKNFQIRFLFCWFYFF